MSHPPALVTHSGSLACALLLLIGSGCSGQIEAQQETGDRSGEPAAAPRPNGPAPIGATPMTPPGSTTVPAPPAPAACVGKTPTGPTRVRLLTRFEFDNTLADLLGDTTRPATALPDEEGRGNLVTHERYRANPVLVQGYLAIAETAARRARDSYAYPCDVTKPDAACAQKTLEGLVTRAFRRPPTTAELSSYQKLFMRWLPEKGFKESFTLVLRAVLQSPQFLYRVEGATPSPYEIASRLSYFLWATMPDEELFRAAAAGGLKSPADVRAQVERMLTHTRGRTGVRELYAQWLGLRALEDVTKAKKVHADFTPAVTGDWRESLLLFVDDVVSRGGSFQDLLGSPRAFLPGRLATLYGVKPGTDGAVNLPSQERAGLLTQPGLMAMLGHPEHTHPVARGLFVREQLLCQTPPPPPEDVPPLSEEAPPGVTTRQMFEIHARSPACAGCHSLFEPIGFGFENYDTVGRWRTMDNGKPVDASGAVNSAPEPALGGPFDGAVALSRKLAASPAVRSCVTSHFLSYALGRDLRDADGCTLSAVSGRFQQGAGNLRDLLIDIATSEALRAPAAPTLAIGGTP